MDRRFARPCLSALSLLGFFVGIGSAAAAELPMRLVSITAPVHPGGGVLLVVQTQSGATCKGDRQGRASDAYSVKLRSQSAAGDGLVWWQWVVVRGKDPIGVRGVRVTCVALGKEGSLETTFDVQ